MKFPALAASLLALAVIASPVLAQDAEQDDQAGQSQTDQQPPADAGTFLQDQRRATELSIPELRKRIRAGRGIIQGGTVDRQTRRQVMLIVRDARQELRSRTGKAGGKAGKTNDQTT